MNVAQNGYTSIPVVDLGAFLNGSDDEKQKIAAEVDDICCSIGFLTIKNHGVSKTVCDKAWASAKAYFDLPIDEKIKSKAANKGNPRGYFPIEGETLSKTLGVSAPPDRKEAYSSGPLTPPTGHKHDQDFDFFYGPNIWPTLPHDFQENWTAYYKAMEKLGSEIMQLLAAALKLNEDFFVQYHTHHISALRAINYPSLPDDLLPGQLRAGTHSDYGTVTILNPDPVVGGLEVKSTSGKWITPPAIENSFVINIGDLMAHWTNDKWVSTLHRVVDPITSNGKPAPRRQSIAYFMNPNYDAKIKTIPTCIKDGQRIVHEQVLAGTYLMNKFKISI